MRKLIFAAVVTSCMTVMPNMAIADDFKTLVAVKSQADINSTTRPSTVPYNYLVNISVSGAEDDEKTEFTAQYRVNPQAEAGSRVEWLSDDIEDYPKDFRKGIDRLETEISAEQIADEFWCEDSDGLFGKEGLNLLEVTNILEESDTEVLVSLEPDTIEKIMQSEDDNDGGMPKKLRKRMKANLRLSKPDLKVTHSHIYLSKPTTVKIVAKIKEMDIQQSCALAPNGVSYVSQQKVRMSGKMLGNTFAQDMVITFSDLQPN